MIKSAFLALCLASVSASAAMILGFGAEADYFAPKANGDFAYQGINSTFTGDNASSYQLGLYLEHPVPLLPNLRIDLTPNAAFSGSGNKVTFNQTDVTPYYEVLDNIVDIDVGVTFKVLDGKVEGTGIDKSFNQVIPMGYLGAAAMLPGLPLSFAGSVKYVGFNGDSLSDAQIKAIWKVIAGLQVQAGYRQESLKIDHFDIKSDVTFKGPFVGVGYSF